MNELGNNPKKRILFVITQTEFGGAQRFLLDLLTHLNPERFECRVAVGATGDDELSRRLSPQFKVYRLRHLERSINPISEFRAIIELRKIIREYKPNTLFLNSSKAGVIGSLAARSFPSLKVVYRIGGWAFNDPNPSILQSFYRFAERLTARFKDTIILNNRHDYEQAIEFIKGRDLKLIHNGINEDELDFKEPTQAREFIEQKIGKNIPSDTLLVGTIANYYLTKGLSYLLSASDLLQKNNPEVKIHFCLIGDGPEKEKLKQMIKDLNLTSVSLIPRFDARAYLKAFDIFALPSVKEGFPWVALESMAAGVPLIASSVGAMPDVIESGRNGLLVPPGDPQALMSGLLELTDKDTRQRFAMEAQKTIHTKFSQKTMIDAIEALL